MGFFDFLDEGLDLFTDFLPGGDLIDDLLGIGANGIGRNGTASNGTSPPPGGVRAPAQVAGCDVELPIAYRNRAYCQPGYVAVDKDGDGVNDTCMLKEVAV